MDVLRRVQIIFDESTLGKTFSEHPVPAEFAERVIEAALSLFAHRAPEEVSLDDVAEAVERARAAAVWITLSLHPPRIERVANDGTDVGRRTQLDDPQVVSGRPGPELRLVIGAEGTGSRVQKKHTTGACHSGDQLSVASNMRRRARSAGTRISSGTTIS